MGMRGRLPLLRRWDGTKVRKAFVCLGLGLDPLPEPIGRLDEGAANKAKGVIGGRQGATSFAALVRSEPPL
jgi:hypothetical protein